MVTLRQDMPTETPIVTVELHTSLGPAAGVAHQGAHARQPPLQQAEQDTIDEAVTMTALLQGLQRYYKLGQTAAAASSSSSSSACSSSTAIPARGPKAKKAKTGVAATTAEADAASSMNLTVEVEVEEDED